MISSLRSRLMLAVGAMAVAAVAAVAVAVREGARQEFLRFRDVERRSASSLLPEHARATAVQLDGHCCEGGDLAAAAARLPADAALLVTRPDDGRLVASAGRALVGVRDVITRLDGSVLSVDAVRERDGRTTRLGLVLHVEGTPLRLSGGGPALLFAIPFPSDERERTSAAFLGSLDRRLLATAALVAGGALLRPALRPEPEKSGPPFAIIDLR